MKITALRETWATAEENDEGGHNVFFFFAWYFDERP